MSNRKQISNTRVLKNTIFLYIRMFILMAVSLFTSRVTLDVLGVEDYGIYNIVGGVVVLFSFLSTALNTATQRFLSVELGNNDIKRYNLVFNTSILIYALFALVIVILSETIGLWFLNNHMNFPSHRIDAVNWVFQLSIVTFILNIIRTPFNASIIANEKMSFYAYTGILEAVLKLVLVYLLYYTCDIDKLKLYSFLISLVSLILLVWYIIFCTKNISGCELSNKIDQTLFKRFFSFSGWSLLGSAAVIGTNQGVNILLNIFWGVTVNAGMGIANQLSQVINQFSANFQTAFIPQIVKNYSTNNIEYHNFVFRTSKLSFYLLFLICLPFLLYIDFILDLWLTEVPIYASKFCFWIIISMLFETISAPMYMVVQANGEIKKYQIIVSCILLFNVLLSYIFLSLGYDPIVVIIIRTIISALLLLFRIVYVSRLISFRINTYFKEVILPSLKVVILGLLIPLISKYYFHLENPNSLLIGLLEIAALVLITLALIFVFGLDKNEKNKIINIVVTKIKKRI